MLGFVLLDLFVRSSSMMSLQFGKISLLPLRLNRLSYLHSEKIVHRDVKTENMLLDKTRTVKIADFGVARVEASNPSDMTGETGTLGYMAPEVLTLLDQSIKYLEVGPCYLSSNR